MVVRGLLTAVFAGALVGCAVVLPPPAAIDPVPVQQVPSIPAPAAQPEEPRGPSAGDPGLVRYRGPVEHIFFHPLMVHPQVALHGSQAQGFNEFFVTVREFRSMLPQLYERDWILVDINDLVTTRQTRHGRVLRRAKLMLPPGKKPLVISVDDLNYYPYMRENKLNSRLVLDADGNVAAQYQDLSGSTVVSRDTEIVPILDQFVETHPDFSFAGSKGVLALTGYEGILGYRTSGDHATKRAKAQVAPVVQRLKDTGWTFASHSYGHPNVAQVSDSSLTVDTADWERNVEPLVGPSQVFVFPFGASVAPGSAKFEELRRAGFRIFCPIAPTARVEIDDGYAIQDRVHVDGISLLTQQSTLRRFFDPESVADPVRPAL